MSNEIVHENDAQVFEQMTGTKLGSRFSVPGYQKDTELHKHVLRKLEAQPQVTEACEAFIEEIKAEQREDIKVPIGDLLVDDHGRLRRRDNQCIENEPHPELSSLEVLPQAWAQLCAKAPGDVDRRMKSNVNSWLSRKKAELVGRTFKPIQTQRSMYALVTEKYKAHDADAIAAEIARVVPKECRGTIQYNGDGGRFEINAALGRPFDADGDLHQIIISARSSDNGTLGQAVYFKAHRLKCTNGIYVMEKALISRTRHIGDRGHLQAQFSKGLAMATEAMESFQVLWRNARAAKFLCAKTGESLDGPEALARLVANKQVVLPHYRKKALLERMMASYEKEPGDSVADVINAVTRTAHESLDQFRSEWFGNDLEEQAGVLLHKANAVGMPLQPMSDDVREKLVA